MNKQTNLTMENLTTYSSPRQRLLGSFGWVTDYVHKIGDFIVTKGIVKDYVNNTYKSVRKAHSFMGGMDSTLFYNLMCMLSLILYTYYSIIYVWKIIIDIQTQQYL